MQPLHSMTGYWGLHSATRDWCEVNYAVTPYVAEFWNTLSALLYTVFAIHLWIQKRRFHGISSFKDSVSLDVFISGMFVLGFASGSFHCTLQYWPQLFDRSVTIWPLIGIRMGFVQLVEVSGFQFTALSICSYILNSLIALVVVFEMYCAFMALDSMYQGYKLIKEYDIKEIKQRGLLTIILSGTAITLWALEIFTCEIFLRRFKWIPQFHAIWHTLTAIAFHETGQIQMYLFLRKAHLRPRLMSIGRLTVKVSCDLEEKNS